MIGEQVSYLDPATAQEVAAEAVDYATETWSVPDRRRSCGSGSAGR